MAMIQQSHKPSYGHCDSFFVESEDTGVFVKKVESKDQIKQFNRLRQKEMAEQLSLQTSYDYQDDILVHMERMQSETMPDVSSIDIQTEIQWFMRPYLIDFLVEAHAAFQLLPETLYLAVNILDRYCSKRVVYKRHYQLVGCAALLIAAKYGDRKDRVPLIKELKSMCCSLYEDEMFTQMEWHVLLTLNWVIGHPTVDSFLQIALSETPYDREVEHMTWYICEMALYHKEFVSVLPSVLARSALALARCILSKEASDQSEWTSQYDASTVVALSHKLHNIPAVLSKKFASSHLSHVSSIVYDFLQHQAQMAAAAAAAAAAMNAAPATPTVQEFHEADMSMSDAYGMPVTPAKVNHHQVTVAHGYATPPITPDHYNAECYVHGKDNNLGVPNHYQLPLPTPPQPSPTSQHCHSQDQLHQQQQQHWYNR